MTEAITFLLRFGANQKSLTDATQVSLWSFDKMILCNICFSQPFSPALLFTPAY